MGCRDIVILVYSEYLPWNGVFGYVCFWGVYFCLFWTMGNPGKFMVCYLFVIFLHACFVVPYFVVLRYCGIVWIYSRRLCLHGDHDHDDHDDRDPEISRSRMSRCHDVTIS